MTTVYNPFDVTPPAAEHVIPERHVNEKNEKANRGYLIFLVVVFLVLTFIVGVLIANTVYFNDLRRQSCGNVPQSQLEIMYWLNLVLAVLAGILWLVIIVLFFIGFWKPSYTEKYIGSYKRPTALSEAQARATGAATVLATGRQPIPAAVVAPITPPATLPAPVVARARV